MNLKIVVSKAVLVLMLVCIVNAANRLGDDELMTEEARLQKLSGSSGGGGEIEVDDKAGLFKYILNVYNKMAVENERLRAEYAQMSAIVKILAETREAASGKDSKRAMKNIALGFGK
jgi:hypothetical protein